MAYEIELHMALEAASRATQIILEQYARLEAKSSAPVDTTTQADRDSQDAILQCLAAEFPDDAFRAEESTPTLARLKQAGDRMWIIDPIDGTRGFVTKNGEFSVMIALIVDGEPVVGIVAEPTVDRVNYAVKSRGCYQRIGPVQPKRVKVTDTNDLRAAALIQSHTKPGRSRSKEVE